MKKIIITSLVFCCFISLAQAQEKGEIRVGASLIYGTDVDKLGVNFGGEYLITENISAAPSYSIFFTDSPLKYNVLNIDGRYYFKTGEGPQLYGMLGYTSATAKVDTGFGTYKATDGGLNIGGGIVYPLGGNFGINGQLKYTTPGNGQLVLQGGVIYSFK